MKTFLVPVDFSDNAFNALVYACRLALETHGEIVLLNCYQVPAGQGTVMIDFKDILERDSIAGLNKMLNQIQSQPDFSELRFHTESYYGFLYEGVEIITKKYQVDLVVMGTIGASNFTRRLFGSNTSHLSRRITTPILAVPAKAKWKKWNCAILATDFVQSKSGIVFKELKKLTNGMKFDVEVLHVIDKTDTKNDYAKLESKFIQSMGTEKVDFHYEPAENVVDGILNYTDKHPCDILVTMRHNHGFIEKLFVASATRDLALHSKNPILLLHD